jgi:hypothetical protein
MRRVPATAMSRIFHRDQLHRGGYKASKHSGLKAPNNSSDQFGDLHAVNDVILATKRYDEIESERCPDA